MDLSPPSERRIYRLGKSLFRIWIERPDAGAEIHKNGEWVWTPIPSGAIAAHPRAVDLRADEIDRLPADPPRPGFGVPPAR